MPLALAGLAGSFRYQGLAVAPRRFARLGT
jgi:hypothetical protein